MGVFDRVKNDSVFVVEGAVNLAKANLFPVSPQLQARRYSICLKCDYRDPNTDRCKICKCFLKNGKTKSPDKHCDMGYW